MTQHEHFDLSIKEMIRQSMNQRIQAGGTSEKSLAIKPVRFSDLDIVLFTRSRWNFTFQQKQQFLEQVATQQRVFYIEEAVAGNSETAFLVENQYMKGVQVITPYLPPGLSETEKNMLLGRLLQELFTRHSIHNSVLWFCTSRALTYSCHMPADMIVYDCDADWSVGEEPGFEEEKSMQKADVVFTSSETFYDAHVGKHSNMHVFPPDTNAYSHVWPQMKGILEITLTEKNILSLSFTGKE